MAKKPEKRTIKRKAKPPAADRLLKLQPDELPLTERRAEYLAELSGTSVREIAGKKLSDVHELLKWKIDPQLFLFRRVCGQVVKKDPISGELLPVPNATVYVEDTDCHLLGYFPAGSPWTWIYPLLCHREVLATVRTDHCGRFCVNLPLWDIDRILRWRRARICHWHWFRPRFRDVLELDPEIGEVRPPRPLPDPPPFSRIQPERIERLRDLAGSAAVERLEVAAELDLQGESPAALEAVLDEPLFARSTQPPLPKGVLREGVETLAESAGLAIEEIDARRFLGPFLRCHDIFIGQWQTVLDVPDITFRVTQDYDGDGVEEEIYSEGFFDVRWNSGSIPDVTLEASGNALATQQCGPVKEIPCGNVPSIEAAGYLDLEPAYHDDGTGFGLRVNRPSPTGAYPPPPVEGIASAVPANAPYAGNLNLHGCVRLNNATHYRINQEYRAMPFAPWGASMPLQGITWIAPRQGAGAPIPFVPDGDGWYPILPAATLVHPNWLLPWNTGARPDGTYRLELELGQLTGGGINSIGTSAKRMFEVDNSRPDASFIEVRWRPASASGPWDNSNSTVVLPSLPGTCPVIHRPTGQDIHVRVVWSAASAHLRNAGLVQSGCGGGGMVLLDTVETPIQESYRHWHTGASNNNVSQTNHYLLPAGRPPGCYSLGIRAWSRAYNPQDFDAASTKDWWVNQGFRWSWPSRAISVVDV